MRNIQKDYMFDYFIQGMDEKMQTTLNMMYLNSCINKCGGEKQVPPAPLKKKFEF